MAILGAGYLQDLLSPGNFTRKINNAKEKLADIKFDAIVGSGNSGAIFGGALSIAMQKPFILVRKEIDREHSHSSHMVEGDNTINSYIFVDDMIFTGSTINRVFVKMNQIIPLAKYIGRYTYNAENLTLAQHCEEYKSWEKYGAKP